MHEFVEEKKKRKSTKLKVKPSVTLLNAMNQELVHH
jgi:hypothetical protein